MTENKWQPLDVSSQSHCCFEWAKRPGFELSYVWDRDDPTSVLSIVAKSDGELVGRATFKFDPVRGTMRIGDLIVAIEPWHQIANAFCVLAEQIADKSLTTFVEDDFWPHTGLWQQPDRPFGKCKIE